VLCNKVIKWGALLKKAESLDADLIATGHYAKIIFDNDHKRYHISVSADRLKDQSYALWRLSQDALSRTIFPLGELTKSKVREIAARLGLKTSATPDSQELCFVPDGDYRKLLYYRLPELKDKTGNGDIIYKGEIVGNHGGYVNYTIGQRRGLKISKGKPLYVTGIDPQSNIVYIDEEHALYKTSFICKVINFQKIAELNTEMQVKVKIRYNDKSGSAVIRPEGENLLVIFNEPRKSITPGQSAVFYDGDDVIGGGIIEEVIN
jgi:tRNA-specific 2-thiouridylase